MEQVQCWVMEELLVSLRGLEKLDSCLPVHLPSLPRKQVHLHHDGEDSMTYGKGLTSVWHVAGARLKISLPEDVGED